jgi:hypothetical protein
MAEVLVDTDVLVDHLRGATRFRPGRSRVLCSVITRAELFAGRGADEDAVRLLLAAFGDVGVDRAVAEAGGRIRRETGIPLPDALVAATALSRGVPVVTRNRRHFEQVRGLRLRTPA